MSTSTCLLECIWSTRDVACPQPCMSLTMPTRVNGLPGMLPVPSCACRWRCPPVWLVYPGCCRPQLCMSLTMPARVNGLPGTLPVPSRACRWRCPPVWLVYLGCRLSPAVHVADDARSCDWSTRDVVVPSCACRWRCPPVWMVYPGCCRPQLCMSLTMPARVTGLPGMLPVPSCACRWRCPPVWLVYPGCCLSPAVHVADDARSCEWSTRDVACPQPCMSLTMPARVTGLPGTSPVPSCACRWRCPPVWLVYPGCRLSPAVHVADDACPCEWSTRDVACPQLCMSLTMPARVNGLPGMSPVPSCACRWRCPPVWMVYPGCCLSPAVHVADDARSCDWYTRDVACPQLCMSLTMPARVTGLPGTLPVPSCACRWRCPLVWLVYPGRCLSPAVHVADDARSCDLSTRDVACPQPCMSLTMPVRVNGLPGVLPVPSCACRWRCPPVWMVYPGCCLSPAVHVADDARPCDWSTRDVACPQLCMSLTMPVRVNGLPGMLPVPSCASRWRCPPVWMVYPGCCLSPAVHVADDARPCDWSTRDVACPQLCMSLTMPARVTGLPGTLPVSSCACRWRCPLVWLVYPGRCLSPAVHVADDARPCDWSTRDVACPQLCMSLTMPARVTGLPGALPVPSCACRWRCPLVWLVYPGRCLSPAVHVADDARPCDWSTRGVACPQLCMSLTMPARVTGLPGTLPVPSCACRWRCWCQRCAAAACLGRPRATSSSSRFPPSSTSSPTTWASRCRRRWTRPPTRSVVRSGPLWSRPVVHCGPDADRDGPGHLPGQWSVVVRSSPLWSRPVVHCGPDADRDGPGHLPGQWSVVVRSGPLWSRPVVHCGPDADRDGPGHLPGQWSVAVHCGPGQWSIVVQMQTEMDPATYQVSGPWWSIVVHCGPGQWSWSILFIIIVKHFNYNYREAF